MSIFLVALLGAVVIAGLPTPEGLSIRGQYALSTMYFAAVLWISGAVPLAVTALSIPALLTAFGVYADLDQALRGFADHLIFLFIAGFMLANALQKYDIDRRIALYMIVRLGSSPRFLVLAVMCATAILSMWVSNTATTAMMTPIALGVLTQVIGREEIESRDDHVATDGGLAQAGDGFTNIQLSMLLGTAYAASVGGVGTLIGTPPNAVLATQLEAMHNYEIGFVDWLFIGLPIVFVTLPLVWYLLTYQFYPPRIDDVGAAREQARTELAELGTLSSRGRWALYIFTATALLWMIGGLDRLAESFLGPMWLTTLFGGEGMTVLGVEGHQGLLYYVMVGLYAIPALVLAETMTIDELLDIDWGVILLFGGGISLADSLADTGATEWIAQSVFDGLTGAPIIVVVGAVVLLIIFLTEMTSNTATASIIVPVLISIGGTFAATLGLAPVSAGIFLAVSGAIAASFAFALPVATPPNAIVFGSGYLEQSHMMRAGVILNLVMTAVLTILIWLLFQFVWPVVLW